MIAKRCVIAAIHGSQAIFFGKDIGPARSYDLVPDQYELPDHPDSIDGEFITTSITTKTSSSRHLTEEEDGEILN